MRRCQVSGAVSRLVEHFIMRALCPVDPVSLEPKRLYTTRASISQVLVSMPNTPPLEPLCAEGRDTQGK